MPGGLFDVWRNVHGTKALVEQTSGSSALAMKSAEISDRYKAAITD